MSSANKVVYLLRHTVSTVKGHAVATLEHKPVLFNSVTGCVLFTGSDALAQRIEYRNAKQTVQNRLCKQEEEESPWRNPTTTTEVTSVKEDGSITTKPLEDNEFSFDRWRSLTAGVIGVAFGGFVYPLAYAKLDSIWTGVTFTAVLKKSLVEIATVGIFANSVSIGCRGLLVGRRGEDVVLHTAREMPRVTLNDIGVWLPYNLVAFAFIPLSVRPVTTSFVEALWQTYISLRSHNYAPEKNGDPKLDSPIGGQSTNDGTAGKETPMRLQH